MVFIARRFLLILLITLPFAVQADTLGFKLGAYAWQQDFDGDVRSSDDRADTLDINDDLGVDDDSNNIFLAVLEHPIPILPNIQLQQTQLETSGSQQLDRSISFDDETFSSGSKVNSDIDLSHIDATLYYELLDNWISLDLGITVRTFSGEVKLAASDGSERSVEDLDGSIPMLYVAAKFDLPLTGLYIGGNASGISSGDSKIADYQINLGYEMDFGLGIEGGYRSFSIDHDDGDEHADITVDGAYLGLFYHF